MLLKVYLPLAVLALAGLMFALELKLVLAPLTMLVVSPYWLAMALGVFLTVRYNFIIGAVAAGAITLALVFAIDPRGMNFETVATALFAPFVPLAIVQLVAAPFRLRVASGQ